ncbi:hypothetical protein [Apibacter mensalis]|uniref:hypothetical protein n=1 Tax=Apibacter mensalis TaxID=1586267 RepID=UPI0026EBC996|nr:hypothetical protein [Apibacter mensalis]
MKKNKFIYIIIISFFLLLAVLVNCYPPKKSLGKPHIYHLRDNYLAHFYVFDNFQDNENCIKYLFNFAKKNKGYLIIMTHKDMYEFDDNIAFIQDTVSHKFIFNREYGMGDDDNTRDFRISVNYLEETKLHFKIEEGRNKDKNFVKKLSADFDSLNVNIVQNFLNYSTFEDYKTRKRFENCIYELYNKKDSLKIRQIYHNFGKWFEIDIL